MLNISQKLFGLLCIVLFLACSTAASAADANKALADARADLDYANLLQTRYMAYATSASDLEQLDLVQAKHIAKAASSFEAALPELIAAQDFWSASKVYFQLALARGRLDETQAACFALTQSLEYYRRALVKDHLSVAYFGDMASDGSDDGDSMAVVRAKLGCGSNMTAASR